VNTLPDKPELDASPVEKGQGPVVAELHAHDPAAFPAGPAGRHELHGSHLQKEFNLPEELPAHTPAELPGTDAVSPVDLSPAELAGRSAVQTAAPVPSAIGRPRTTEVAFQDAKSATEEPTPVSPLAQPEYSPRGDKFPRR